MKTMSKNILQSIWMIKVKLMNCYHKLHKKTCVVGAKKWDIFFGFSLLKIPILLHMICVLFICKLTLPNTRTGILQAIVDKCIDREAIKVKGKRQ